MCHLSFGFSIFNQREMIFHSNKGSSWGEENITLWRGHSRDPLRSVHTAACVEACQWACLKLDQQPITWISRPGHTSTRFDWLELVLAYDLIGWRFCRSFKSWTLLNFWSEQREQSEASNASKAKRRSHNAVRQSVTSPHSKWMGRSVEASTHAAVWTGRYTQTRLMLCGFKVERAESLHMTWECWLSGWSQCSNT